ncbi:hypothetical protein AB0O82_38025 [Kitasatospora sp. NPDC088264]|uniref:hypothetical protein n=1 Tax=Kitasatospora sp. NPDC088264 TaxID=3155296 RepID=UPI003437E545
MSTTAITSGIPALVAHTWRRGIAGNFLADVSGRSGVIAEARRDLAEHPHRAGRPYTEEPVTITSDEETSPAVHVELRGIGRRGLAPGIARWRLNELAVINYVSAYTVVGAW